MAENMVQKNAAQEEDPSVIASRLQQMLSQISTDEDYREYLKKNGRHIFSEIGMSLPQGVSVKVVDNHDDLVHVVFPPDPNAPLREEWMEILSGGGGSRLDPRQSSHLVAQISFMHSFVEPEGVIRKPASR